MTKNNEQIIDNLGSEKCVHRAHLGYKNAPYFKKCYSCRLQNNQLEALQANNTTEYWYKCNTENCLLKKLKDKEQECEELKEIINEAKNSKLDLKSFLVGESVQNEYEQQLDQLKAEKEKLKEALKNIAKGKIGKYSCAEEYAMNVLKINEVLNV